MSSSSTPPNTSFDSYREYLAAQRPDLREAITAGVEKLSIYRSLPREVVIQAVDGTLDVFFTTLAAKDMSVLLSWVKQRLLVRFGQGLPFVEAIELPAIFRRHFIGFSLPAIADKIEGAAEGIAYMSEACDKVVEAIGELYRTLLESTSTELRRFKLLAETVIDGISVANTQRQITYANPAYRKLTGYDDQIIGMQISEVLDPAALEDIRAEIWPALESVGSWQGVVRYRHADGTIFPVQLSVVTLQNESGAFDGTAVVVRDVREQQAREQRLRMFEALVEKSVDGMLVTNKQGQIQYVNAASVQMNGFASAEQMSGLPRQKLIAPEALEQLDREITPQLREKGSWQGTLWCIRPDGSRWLTQASTFILTDAAGRTIGTGGVTRDITADHEAEAERARLQEEIIRVQDATLRELSTPLLMVSDRVLVMPLVGAIDSRRAQQIIETLLEGITAHSADIAILDITGVLLVDTQVANALLRSAQAVRLLGAQVVLTGIRPEVAQTLVGLGANLGDIVTRSTLQSGIAYAIGRS
jgi:rsbT co-antagonist protein RsbR